MPSQPIFISPILVEREAELVALASFVSQTLAGTCQVVVLDGMAGSGKSRLARAVVNSCEEQGLQVLSGICTDRDLDFPLAPFVDALRQRVVATAGNPATLLGPQSAILLELLPEYALQSHRAANSQRLTPEQGKRQLFEAYVALLGRLATEQPMLLVLEDIHWSDPTSLELLELVPRRLSTTPILILATCRGGEASAELAHTLATLHRQRRVHRLILEPISAQGVAEMLESMLHLPPPRALVTAIHGRSGGNPFLVEELLASRRPGGQWTIDESVIPSSIRDVVLQQMTGLDRLHLHVLDLAAVAGEQVDLRLLQDLSELDDDAFLEVTRVLVERRLLTEERNAPMLRFRHALVRDVILDRLLTGERRQLHGKVGEARERMAGNTSPDAAGELGHHFHRAEMWAKTLDYAESAGNAALAVLATAEAHAHFRRSLDAAIALNHPAQARLQLQCGQTLAMLGNYDLAQKHLEEALRLAENDSNRGLRLDVHFALAGLHASRDYRVAERIAEQAHLVAIAQDDPRREARALNLLGNIRTNLMQFSAGRELHQRSLQIATQLNDRWAMADTLDFIGMSHYLAGEVIEAREAFGRAGEVFLELNDVERAASALTSRGLYLAVLDGACGSDASTATYRSDAARGLAMSREVGWRAGEAYALVALASCDLGLGAFGTAGHHLDSALAIAREIEHPQWSVIGHLTYGLLHVALLDDVRACEHFGAAVGVATRIGAHQWVDRLQAWQQRCTLRLEGVGSSPLAERMDAVPASIGQRRSLITQAESDLDHGNPDLALSATRRLLEGNSGALSAEGMLLYARTVAALGRLPEADTACLDARHIAEAAGPHHLLWQIAATRAELWAARDEEIVREEIGLARSIVEEMASEIPDLAWRSSFERAASARLSRAPSGRQRTRFSSEIGGLTPREQSVAWCVSQGMSNKEIARTLSISVKTVEMHIGSCLGKLGFTSRSQIAVWGARSELPTPADPGPMQGS